MTDIEPRGRKPIFLNSGKGPKPSYMQSTPTEFT